MAEMSKFIKSQPLLLSVDVLATAAFCGMISDHVIDRERQQNGRLPK